MEQNKPPQRVVVYDSGNTSLQSLKERIHEEYKKGWYVHQIVTGEMGAGFQIQLVVYRKD